MPQIPTSFDVKIYGELTPYELNPNMSKARVSVFRKYENLNGSYFTDEVADKMIHTIPGMPVIGRYDEESQDFTQHFTPKDTKAYGFIPPDNYNFAWESRTESDGREYEYACFDVVLWTSRYAEASQIINKSQSMELDPKSVTGEWQVQNGNAVFVYSDASVYGICVLGDNVRPCFDGACFFEQSEQLDTYIAAIREEIKNNFSFMVEEENAGGKDQMQFEMNLPEGLYSAVFFHLNRANEETGSVEVKNTIFSIDNGTVMYYNLEDNKLYSMQYEDTTSTNEAGEEVSERVYHEPVEFAAVIGCTSEQKADVEAMFAAETTYAAMNEKIAALENDKATEAENFSAQITTLQNKINEYEARDAAALEVKKDELIDSYASMVDEDVLASVKENKANFSLEQIEGKLAVNFARKAQTGHDRVPTPQPQPEDPMLALLNKHLKKGE